jgi:hypothetical protein
MVFGRRDNKRVFLRLSSAKAREEKESGVVLPATISTSHHKQPACAKQGAYVCKNSRSVHLRGKPKRHSCQLSLDRLFVNTSFLLMQSIHKLFEMRIFVLEVKKCLRGCAHSPILLPSFIFTTACD